MWTDNETTEDFLNFSGIAKTVAEIIEQAKTRPISIGVSGVWGVGKSSMIKLVRAELAQAPKNKGNDLSRYVFVEFNAWLYQGYDDARAALIEVVAETLAKEAEERKTGTEIAKDLLKRVDWVRAGKLTATSVAALAAGLPPVGLLGELWGLGKRVVSGGIDQESLQSAEEVAEKAAESTAGIIKQKETPSPPKQIEALRGNFEALLKKLDVTLVVLIDDLDRCLPKTASL